MGLILWKENTGFIPKNTFEIKSAERDATRAEIITTGEKFL